MTFIKDVALCFVTPLAAKSNEWGKLGNNSTENIKNATEIESLKEAAEYGIRIQDMSIGESHGMAILGSWNIDETNNQKELVTNLVVWGCGVNCQLGIDDNNLDMVLIPHQLEIEPFNTFLIRSVHACHNYSAVLTSNGDVYTWGSGEFNRLGYKALKKQQKIPKKVDLIGKKIEKLSLGVYHAAGITSEGKIITWGAGMSGQLGRGTIIILFV